MTTVKCEAADRCRGGCGHEVEHLDNSICDMPCENEKGVIGSICIPVHHTGKHNVVTSWRLRKLKARHVISYHDVANAFSSPMHSWMDQTIKECAHPEDAKLVGGRYGQAIMHIRAHEGRTEGQG